MANTELVFLAAGEGQRFGSDKRWATMPNGDPLWLSSLKVYAAAGMSGVVVIREGESGDFEPIMPKQFSLVENPNAQQGMESSRTVGLSSINADYVLIALADMPFIQQATIAALLSERHSALIVQPAINQMIGHPKLFERSMYQALSACTSTNATKALLQTNAAETLCIDVDDAGILKDIDFLADLPTH